MSLTIGILFVVRLVTAPEPLIPISILSDPVARCALTLNTFAWAPIVGLNIFMPMYLQSVLGMSATSAGLSLMVIMATLNASAGLTGQLLGRVKHYKRLPGLGLLIAIATLIVMGWRASTLTHDRGRTLARRARHRDSDRWRRSPWWRCRIRSRSIISAPRSARSASPAICAPP